VITFIATEVALFDVAYITFMAYGGAPKAKHCFGSKYLVCRCKFVDCNVERVPCDRIEKRCEPTLFLGKASKM
jgi:hypothetical protein